MTIYQHLLLSILPIISSPLLSTSSTHLLIMIGTAEGACVAKVTLVATPPGTPPVRLSLVTTVSRSAPNRAVTPDSDLLPGRPAKF